MIMQLPLRLAARSRWQAVGRLSFQTPCSTHATVPPRHCIQRNGNCSPCKSAGTPEGGAEGDFAILIWVRITFFAFATCIAGKRGCSIPRKVPTSVILVSSRCVRHFDQFGLSPLQTPISYGRGPNYLPTSAGLILQRFDYLKRDDCLSQFLSDWRSSACPKTRLLAQKTRH